MKRCDWCGELHKTTTEIICLMCDTKITYEITWERTTVAGRGHVLKGPCVAVNGWVPCPICYKKGFAVENHSDQSLRRSRQR